MQWLTRLTFSNSDLMIQRKYNARDHTIQLNIIIPLILLLFYSVLLSFYLFLVLVFLLILLHFMLQLGDLKLDELLDTPPPGLDEAISISKAHPISCSLEHTLENVILVLDFFPFFLTF